MPGFRRLKRAQRITAPPTPFGRREAAATAAGQSASRPDGLIKRWSARSLDGSAYPRGWFAHLQCPGSGPHTPAKTTRGANAHPVAPDVRTRGGGASRSARTSCASRSREAGAAATARAGLGATRQSEGLLRVRGRARLRTPAPDPSGRSQPGYPCAGRRFKRRFEAAEQAFAVHPSVGAAAILVANRFAGRALVVRRDRAIHSPLRYVDSNVSISQPNHPRLRRAGSWSCGDRRITSGRLRTRTIPKGGRRPAPHRPPKCRRRSSP